MRHASSTRSAARTLPYVNSIGNSLNRPACGPRKGYLTCPAQNLVAIQDLCFYKLWRRLFPLGEEIGYWGVCTAGKISLGRTGDVALRPGPRCTFPLVSPIVTCL